MDERKNLEREAETARANMNELADELGERAKVGKRMKIAVVDKTKATGAYLKSHPVAMGIAGALVGLAAGMLIPVSRRERRVLDDVRAKLQDKLDEVTGLAELDEDSDAAVSPDMDMTALAGEEDALDRMEATDASTDEDEDDDEDEDRDEDGGGRGSTDPSRLPS